MSDHMDGAGIVAVVIAIIAGILSWQSSVESERDIEESIRRIELSRELDEQRYREAGLR